MPYPAPSESSRVMRWGDELGYRLLCWLKPGERSEGGAVTNASYVRRIKQAIGDSGWDELKDKSIIDFGCGTGAGSIELAQQGARKVIGLDIRPEQLGLARTSAEEAGVVERCRFTDAVNEPVDVIVSVDAFEHFEQPDEILRRMDELLRPGGFVLVSFGPTWFHPAGGHLFSIFPWSHLIFSENALIKWRANFKNDGATRFSEVSGGLNRISIRKFVTFVQQSGFRFEFFRTVPIRALAWAHSRITREFTTSIVECKLVKKSAC